ncbi:acyl-CoA dehydrogenase [Pseudomonas capeferrum]|uniref:acyl-CoA dehydrogenase n=1 Tax=Pseudomonas capeferrum TaxID=1495066 RepID=UPI0015E36F96|nr:acyl-CoA dehydrogenase [Pseudomonas capeferrum]MBA1204242.1 acyl-CoA dehydrogenase [Pseudomonas capeferrum]
MNDHASVSELLRDSANDFLAGNHAPSRLRGWIGRVRPLERRLWQGMAELGWTGVMLPEVLGGSELGLSEACVLTEVMGRHLLAEPFVACCVMPSVLLQAAARHNHSADVAELAGWLSLAERPITLAWQEAAGQLALPLPACRVENGVLWGSKQFVLGCEEDSVLLVSAQLDGQFALVAIAADASGVAIDDFAAGIGAQAHVHFNEAPLLYAEPLLVGAEAELALRQALAAGRIAHSAEQAGQAAGCLQQTLDYVSQRVQFARPLGSFQTVQHRCVDLHIEISLANAAWQHALECYEQAPLASTTEAAISAAKARCGSAARLTSKQAVQLHGAMGFAEEVDIGLYLRAAQFGGAWLGSVEAHRRRFAAAYPSVRAQQLADTEGLEIQLSASSDPREWSDDEFRLRLRRWLQGHYPAHLKQSDRRPFLRLRGDDLRDWLRLLDNHGWRAPAWPREYGGMGISFSKQWIYQQEMERAGVGRIIDNGETQLGPTLIQWGSQAQRAYYLPRILRCEDVWCQGYSEPGAGSDLASLRTQAVREGDEYVVSGQKIWSTHATDCTHIFTLVRTGKFEKKQQGISFLLIDLNAPGVSIRPIANIAGENEFCEVFFDAVRVPAENLVGELHQGWSVAKALLGHERIWLGSSAMAGSALDLAERLVAQLHRSGDQGVLDRLGSLQADLHDYRLLYAQLCTRIAQQGIEPGPEASVLKVYVSELLQRITEFNLEVSEEYGGVVGDVQIGNLGTDLHWPLMMARPVSVYAGANEIQRDILAKAVLNLPNAPRG